MPRLNTRGQALMGIGSGPASVDGRVLIAPGGSACWLDDDTILVNSDALGSWQVLAVRVADGGITVVRPGGGDPLVAGSRRWLGWLNGVGVFGSLGSMPAAYPRAAGLDGTLGYCPAYQPDGLGLVLVGPNGERAEIPAALVYDLQILGPGRAVWWDGHGVQAIGVPTPQPALPSGRLRRVEVAGEVWLVYWSEGHGLIAQLDGAWDGYILEHQPLAFSHDAVVAQGEIFVAWSSTQGEAPGDLHKVWIDRSQPRVPLVSQPSIPTFTFTHPVILAPFKDPLGESGAPWEILVNQTPQALARPCVVAEDTLDAPRVGPLLGLYSEQDGDPSAVLALAEAHATRLVLAHDGPGPWFLPPGLRPWDLPAVECYRYEGESLPAAQTRWSTDVDALLAQWPGDCGLIPQFYCMGGAPPDELWPVSEILLGLEGFSDLVNRSPRLKLLAPFAWQRANGIVAHPELQQAFANLRSAAESAGLATLLPIDPEEPEPEPEPPPMTYDLSAQIRAERAKYPATLDNTAAAAMLNAVAFTENQRLGQVVWGLSTKPSGNNVPSAQGVLVAYDILEVKGERRLFDCFTGDWHLCTPVWAETTYHNDPANRPWLAPVGVAGPVPGPDPGPGPTPPTPCPECPDLMANPTYDAFIKGVGGAPAETQQFYDTYVAHHGHPPAPSDYGHFTWIRLREFVPLDKALAGV